MFRRGSYVLCKYFGLKTNKCIKGPTIEFAASHRGNHADAAPGRQALWKNFATRPSGKNQSRVVELSQGWTEATLKIPLDKYSPMPTDKQYYAWFENEVEHHFATPPYGISNLDISSAAIHNFLAQNSDEYIAMHIKDASDTTRQTFAIAQELKVRLTPIMYAVLPGLSRLITILVFFSSCCKSSEAVGWMSIH
jgi:hypothetical protein